MRGLCLSAYSTTRQRLQPWRTPKPLVPPPGPTQPESVLAMVPNSMIKTKYTQTTWDSIAYDVVDGENTSSSLQLTPPPVLITPINDPDNVTAIEGKLFRFSGLKRMRHSYAGDQR